MNRIRLAALAVALGSLLAQTRSQANLTFSLLADAGTPQNVVDGFALAASRWSAVLADDLTVNLDIGFLSLPSGIVAQAAPVFLDRDYSVVTAALNGHPTSADDFSAYSHLQPGPAYSRLINHTCDNPAGANSGIPYVNSLPSVTLTRANAKVLGLLGASPALDGTIRFNSATAFDFNPADGTSAGQIDFVTAAAHEIGHALGFVSAVDKVETLLGAGPASQIPATVFDLFRFSTASLAPGAGVLDDTADARAKFFSVDGASAVAQFANGAGYGGGYEASHWKEWTFTGLMDPTLFPGTQRAIGTTDLRAFDVLGYTLLVPEPATATVLMAGVVFLCARRRRDGAHGRPRLKTQLRPAPGRGNCLRWQSRCCAPARRPSPDRWGLPRSRCPGPAGCRGCAGNTRGADTT